MAERDETWESTWTVGLLWYSSVKRPTFQVCYKTEMKPTRFVPYWLIVGPLQIRLAQAYPRYIVEELDLSSNSIQKVSFTYVISPCPPPIGGHWLAGWELGRIPEGLGCYHCVPLDYYLDPPSSFSAPECQLSSQPSSLILLTSQMLWRLWFLHLLLPPLMFDDVVEWGHGPLEQDLPYPSWNDSNTTVAR